MNKTSSYKILSVGGSIIIPKTGFDIKFLKKFRAMILARVKKGEKFVLVIGGGATCRVYQDALKKTTKISNVDLDWLGIYNNF
jgi:uridylate kinase